MSDYVCRRCSVQRVNVLCDLYEQGIQQGKEKSAHQLKKLVQKASAKNYKDGLQILQPRLAPDLVRKLAWNISSFLKDTDFEELGIQLHGRKKSC
jgi:ABC-type Zn uptake system ZnuABC Zn-binding protein ZnuA